LGQFDTELEAHHRYCQELESIGETLIKVAPNSTIATIECIEEIKEAQ
jgi:hypothetical protein